LNVFVWEYLSSGAYGEELLPVSLLREGQAMLLASVKDFCKAKNCVVSTLWDERLEKFSLPESIADQVEVHSVSNVANEKKSFEKCCREADYVFLVAPEFDKILLNRVSEAREYCDNVLLSSHEMIDLCSDKFKTAKWLEPIGIPIIKTNRFNFQKPFDKNDFPLVIKPSDGAGSTNTFLIHNQQQFKELINSQPVLKNDKINWVWQPYIEGKSFSVAAIRANTRDQFQIFPIAHQDISNDGRFQYSRGTIPYEGKGSFEIKTIAENILKQLPDLNGYIGFDFIVPDHNKSEPVLLEINPRLTTSFIGYSELTKESILGKLVEDQSGFTPIEWNRTSVEFTSGGEIVSLKQLEYKN
jgi:tyramine---L-glutamate ligase